MRRRPHSPRTTQPRPVRRFAHPAWPLRPPRLTGSAAAGRDLPTPFCVCGSYSVGIGQTAPGTMTAQPTTGLQSSDAWGVPVRVSREGHAQSRQHKQGKKAGGGGRSGGHHQHQQPAGEHACLMIAHRPPQQGGGGGTHNAVYLSLSRYNGCARATNRCFGRKGLGLGLFKWSRDAAACPLSFSAAAPTAPPQPTRHIVFGGGA